MIRHAIATVLGLYIPCRHRRQSVTGRRLAAGAYEMFLVCSLCGKRISPGVVLVADAARVPANPPTSAARLAAPGWLPE